MVAVARRQLASLAGENQEQMNLATQRMSEIDARANEANSEQRKTIHTLVRRLRESATDRARAAWEKNQTLSFDPDDAPQDPVAGHAKRWPGSPEPRQSRGNSSGGDTQPADTAERDGEHRRQLSWEESWRPTDGADPRARDQNTEAGRDLPPAPPRRHAQPSPVTDEDDMSEQRWLR
ncbi:MAG: hypothetical protein ACRDQ5_00075 [Sciscionella sp.]